MTPEEIDALLNRIKKPPVSGREELFRNKNHNKNPETLTSYPAYWIQSHSAEGKTTISAPCKICGKIKTSKYAVKNIHRFANSGCKDCTKLLSLYPHQRKAATPKTLYTIKLQCPHCKKEKQIQYRLNGKPYSLPNPIKCGECRKNIVSINIISSKTH